MLCHVNVLNPNINIVYVVFCDVLTYVLCDVTFYPSSFSDPNYPFMGSINNNNNNNIFREKTVNLPIPK